MAYTKTQNYNAGINLLMAYIVQHHKHESNYAPKRASTFFGSMKFHKITIIDYCCTLDHEFFSQNKIKLQIFVDGRSLMFVENSNLFYSYCCLLSQFREVMVNELMTYIL